MGFGGPAFAGCGGSGAMNVIEGEVLAGKFRIERVIGRGGMGVVVAATHVHLGERVALKFLLPEALENPEAVQRFAREARAAVRIKSEHVGRVSDVGTLDNGAPYMVMEFLDGIDLSEWLLRRGVLPIEQAVEFMLQACEALAEAHILGIVHRDLKPANLFVIERPDGTLAIKVLDFGISKTAGLANSGASMTKTSAAMGSPLYMSPEQMQSAKDVDPRGDIWALGVVLYELISARTPFPGETIAELVLKVVTAVPRPLAGVSPPVPPRLEAVIFKCLEKEREQRFQNIGELAAALAEFAPRHSKISVRRIASLMQRAGMSATGPRAPASSDRGVAPAVPATSTVPAPQTMASWEQTHPTPNRRRNVAIVAMMMAIPALAVGALALHRSGALATAQGSVSARSPVLEKAAMAQQSAAVVEPAAKPPAPPPSQVVVEPSAEAALAPPAAPSAGAPRKAARISRASVKVLAAASSASAAPAVNKSASPPPGKNPMKMIIQ